MQNSQLILILSSLSKKENRELRKWLVSPIHNQRSDVVQLYEYLTSGNRLEDDKSLEKERIYRKLYPKEAYDDARMRQVIHFLQEAIEKYFIYLTFQDDTTRQRLNLVRLYREKKLTKLYLKNIKLVEELYSTKIKKDEDYFELAFLLEREKSEEVSEKSRAARFQEMSDSMETLFIARKLKLACGMITYQKIYRTEYDFGLIEPVLIHVKERSNFLKIPIIKIYYDIYHLFKNPNIESNYFEVRKDISEFDDELPDSEKLDIYMAALNYCIGKMNTGSSNYAREAFNIFSKGLEAGIFTQGGLISPHNFRNFVAIAATLKEFDWVNNFIEIYQNFLHLEYRDNFVKFSLARLYFEQKDYDRAQNLLIQFDIDDILINLTSKTMLIRLYYEKDEFMALESLLDSMRAYINRKKMLAYHKMSFKELISASKRLIKIQFNDHKRIEVLTNQITNSRTLPSHMKEWFLTQLGKLKR